MADFLGAPAGSIDSSHFLAIQGGGGGRPPEHSDRHPDEWNLLSAIVESSDDAILTKDLDGTITSWNAGAERIYGYSAAEMIGRSVASLVPPGREDEIPALLARLRGGERIKHFETERVARDGRRLHVSLTISPLLDRTGSVIGASTIARDITDRRHEAKRWRLFSALGAAIARAPDLEHLHDDLARLLTGDLADYCTTYLRDGGRIRRLGCAHRLPEMEPLLARLDELAPPAVKDAHGVGAVVRTREPVLDNGTGLSLLPNTVDPEYRRCMESLAPISTMLLPLVARGRSIGALALSTSAASGKRFGKEDLELGVALADRAALALDNMRLYGEARAELKRRAGAEKQLTRRYQQLQVLYRMTEAVGRAGAAEEIYEQALDGLRFSLDVERASILLFDEDGVMRFRAWRGLSDGYRQAVEGHSPWTPDAVEPSPIVIPDVASARDFDPGLKETILAEGIRAVAFIPLVFRGRLLGKFMLYFNTPRTLDIEEVGMARTIASTIGFAITRARDEQSVRDAKESAERASEAKSQFLGIMSHELRTPLNAVLGYAELLLLETKGTLTDGQREQLERIQVSARHQLELVEELLTYTRLEAGREEPRLISSDVRRIVADVIEFVRPEAEAKRLSLCAEVPDAPLISYTDPAKLRQIALNLASNAIKYTDSGEVVFQLREEDAHLSLEVRDTGPGIPGDMLEYIFEPFARVDESRTRITSGTGLGLAIARRLASLLGGTVEVESRHGQGSIFSLRIPVASKTPLRD
jgi:PAS domain S-box-containing protein